jgi:putative toxin-antitoxin system antitoxin component (TIGR02293 family)
VLPGKRRVPEHRESVSSQTERVYLRVSTLLGGKLIKEVKCVPSCEVAMGFHTAVMEGFTVVQAERVRGAYGIPQKDFFRLVGVTERTASRKLRSTRRLSVASSDRVLRLARVIAFATEVFGNDVGARSWLNKKQKALCGVKPTDMLATEEGTRQVENLLGAIEHGLYI